MDWSEVLTEREGVYMTRLLPRLAQAPWASRLVAAIADGGGVTYKNKPLLFEARVGHALSQTQVALLAYEVSTRRGRQYR
jgi:hypothetical protein